MTATKRKRDPRLNEHGVFVRGFNRTVSPRIRATARHSIVIRPIERADGRWVAEYDFKGRESWASGPASTREPGAANERDCVLQELDQAIRWMKNDKNGSAAIQRERRIALEDVEAFRKAYAARTVAVAQNHMETKAMGKSARKSKAAKPAPKRGWKRGDDVVAAGREHLSGKKKAPQVPAGVLMVLRIDQIELPTHQVRKHFDEGELEALAATIKQHGILQPLLIREVEVFKPDRPRFIAGIRYVLAAGERRLRAAQIAFLQEVPCNVRKMTDAEFDDVQLVENLQRVNLNPIEEAEAFYQATVVSKRHTQQELANRLGVTQGHIGNRIALLKHSQPVRDLVAKGEMPPTHARVLQPIGDRPELAKEVLKAWQKDLSLPKWEEAARRAMFDATRGMDPAIHDGPLFGKIVGEISEQLDVIEVPLPHDSSRKVKRAANTDLWDRMQKAAKDRKKKQEQHGAETQRGLDAIDRRVELEEKQAAAARGETPARKPAASKPAPKKSAAQAAAERQAFGAKLYRFKTDWLCDQVAQTLSKKTPADVVGRLWVLLAARGNDMPTEVDDWICDLAGQRKKNPEPSVMCDAVAHVKTSDWNEFARELLVKMFAVQRDGKFHDLFWDSGILGQVAAIAGVTLDVFRADEDFLQLWSDEQLWHLAYREPFQNQSEQILSTDTEDLQDVQPGEFPAGRLNTVYNLIQAWPTPGWCPIELSTVDADGRFQEDTPRKKFALS